MTVFGTPGRLVSWARRCPQTRQSGKKTTSGKAGKGNPYLNGILGEIAASASRTDTFLGERYRRLARRRGKRKALAAIARSILVIIFHLLADPDSPLPRPRPRLLRHPPRQAAQDPQPHPPARGPRPDRHPHTCRKHRRLARHRRHASQTLPASVGQGPLPPARRRSPISSVVLTLAAAGRYLLAGGWRAGIRSWAPPGETRGSARAGGAGARPYLGPRDRAGWSRRHDDRWRGPAGCVAAPVFRGRPAVTCTGWRQDPCGTSATGDGHGASVA